MLATIFGIALPISLGIYFILMAIDKIRDLFK